jgi:regulatory protein
MTVPRKIISLQEAKLKAEKYCAYQERCHSEVKNKLITFGLNKNDVDEVLMHLIQNNYLNEERFVKAFVGGKFRTKNWGRKKIIYQLQCKGINKTLIEQGLKQIDAPAYGATLIELLEKKAGQLQGKNKMQQMAALTRYLTGKGFEMDLAIENVKIFLNKAED